MALYFDRLVKITIELNILTKIFLKYKIDNVKREEKQMSTISFHTDITTSISHNNRINIYGNKDINLDKLKENIYYIQKDIKDLYRDEFGDAVMSIILNKKELTEK